MQLKPHKDLHKARFYLSRFTEVLASSLWQRADYANLINRLAPREDERLARLLDRLTYYNRLGVNQPVTPGAFPVGSLWKQRKKTRILDLMHIFRHFDRELKIDFTIEDIATVPAKPTFVKSRPIEEPNSPSLLLKLGEIRNYYWRRDRLPHAQKEPRAVWRGACHQPHRQAFIQRASNSRRLDAGDVRAQASPNLQRPFMSLREQMKYRFIVSLEGNDVGTNLKWIMRSNSVCMMPRPQVESWFMEGCLQAGKHYVEISSDPDDIDEKIEYFASHLDEAEEIVRAAQSFADEFYQRDNEVLLQLLVALKYFVRSGQLTCDKRLPQAIREAL